VGLPSFSACQLEKFFPSNKTVASEGGLLASTGVITFGTGSHTSVALGSPTCWPHAEINTIDKAKIEVAIL
jgi:hypothetical protein